MRDAFRIDNACRFLVFIIPDSCCDGGRCIAGGGLVAGRIQFVVIRRGIAIRIQILHFSHTDDGCRAGIEPQDVHMGEIHHIGITGGSIHEDGHIGKECRYDQEAAFTVGCSRK